MTFISWGDYQATALAEKFVQYFQNVKEQELFLQSFDFLFPTELEDIAAHAEKLNDYYWGMFSLLQHPAVSSVFKGDYSLMATLRAFQQKLSEHFQLLNEHLEKSKQEETQQLQRQKAQAIEQQREDNYPGYRDFRAACLQLLEDKQFEVNEFLNTIWLVVQKFHEIDEVAAWGLLKPLLDEMVAIKKGKVGVESLGKIAAFIKEVKTKLFPGASPEQLQGINSFLRKSVGAELLQAAYPSQNNVVVVRLWLREVDMHPESPTVAGVQSGGHLAIHIYDNDDKQKYFSFVTTNEVVKEAGVLGQFAKKLLKIPAGNDLKGSLAQLVHELDAVYFQEAGRYVACKQVLIPLSEADFAGVGLSGSGLNAWADEFERKVKSGEMTYNFYSNNCSTIVAEALKKGGAEAFVSLSEAIHKPKSIFEYAETVASEVTKKQDKATKKKHTQLGIKQPRKNSLSLEKQAADVYLDYVASVDADVRPMTPEEFLQAQEKQKSQEALRAALFVASPQEVHKQLRPGFWRNLFLSNPAEKLNVNDIVDVITQTQQGERFELMEQLFKKPSFLERVLEVFKGEDKAPARFYRAILKQSETFSQLIKKLHTMNDNASLSVLDSYAVTDHKLLIAYAEALIGLDKTEKNAAYFKHFMNYLDEKLLPVQFGKADPKIEKALECLKKHENTRSAVLAYEEDQHDGLVNGDAARSLDTDTDKTEDTATPVSSDHELFLSDDEDKKGYEFGRH